MKLSPKAQVLVLSILSVILLLVLGYIFREYVTMNYTGIISAIVFLVCGIGFFLLSHLISTLGYRDKSLGFYMMITYLTSFFYLIAWLAVGYIQDLNGARCSGIMGASISCAEAQLFPVVWFGIPLFLLITTIGGVSYSLFGKKNSKKKRSLKK